MTTLPDFTDQLRKRPAYKASIPSVPAADSPDLSKLDARRIRLEHPPPEPVPVFRLANQQISTAGNITVVSAQAKGGKTAVIGAMLAAILAADNEHEEADCFGFVAAPTSGKAVILFDTEQSCFDSWQLVRRAATRAGVDEHPPNLRAYGVLDVGTKERRLFLKAELDRASGECGGIHSVIVDGVADLCIDPNDTAEAFGLVEELVQLSVLHNAPIITVLHENPSGAESGKTRGHLGSQLERKAESNLRVVKDAKGVSTIYSDRCRRASIPKDIGPRFAWSTEAGMHVTVWTDAKTDKADQKRKAELPVMEAVFEGHIGAMSWAILIERLASKATVKGRTAERRIKSWVDLELIAKRKDGYVRL